MLSSSEGYRAEALVGRIGSGAKWNRKLLRTSDSKLSLAPIPCNRLILARECALSKVAHGSIESE
jgi:hypothetical protein